MSTPHTAANSDARKRQAAREAQPDGDVEALAAVLIEEGAGVGNSIHSWRCDYPERYGPCDCVNEAARGVLASDWLAAHDAQVRREHGERIARAIEALPGPDEVGIKGWPPADQEAYLLGIEEAARIARQEADR